MNVRGVRLLAPSQAGREPLLPAAQRQVRSIYRYAYLVRHLIRSALAKQSTGTIFGALWWLADPLVLMAVYVFFVGVILKAGIKDFALFVLVGVILWKHVSSGIQAAIQGTMAREYAMRQVAFPRGAVPLAAVLAETVHLFIGFGIFVVVGAVFGVYPTLVFPLVFVLVAIQVALVLGLAFALSALNIYFRDVQNLTEYSLRVGMFLSPVLYKTSMVPSGFQQWFKLNPFTTLIPDFRDVLLYGTMPSWPAVAAVAVFAGFVLVTGFLVFVHLEPSFAKVN